jgi:fructokinase
LEENIKILCFGEILWDYLPAGRRPGGAPMNVAWHLNRFGMNSLIASSVGADQEGRDLTDFVKSSEMDSGLIQVNSDLPTSKVHVHLDENNNASYEICEPVAWDDIMLDQNLINEARQAKAIVYGSLVARNKSTRDTLCKLLKNDFLKIMDVNLRVPHNHREIVEMLIQRSDIIKLNEDELTIISNWYNLSGTLRERMLGIQREHHLKSVIVTRGKDGACLIDKGNFYSHQGYKVITTDTVGSGDAFLAGYLASYFKGTDINQALSQACAVGAFVASQSGATPAYSHSTIQSFIESAK